jgi:hypothetical protein
LRNGHSGENTQSTITSHLDGANVSQDGRLGAWFGQRRSDTLFGQNLHDAADNSD